MEYDDYYDDAEEEEVRPPAVTPIQGPIFLKNGTVPVVPLFSYPVINNGTFVQIPVCRTVHFIVDPSAKSRDELDSVISLTLSTEISSFRRLMVKIVNS